MRFSLLGSGSSGNVTLVETDRVSVLIDAGLSARETEKRLQQIGRSLTKIDAILLTHEHEDHARGLEVLAETNRFAVVATRGTLRAVARFLPPTIERIQIGREGEVRIGDLAITAFPVPHDAREPVGFRLSSGTARLGYSTDLGMVNDLVRERLGGLTTLILESNHDVEMVKSGPYPQRLKKRILSPFGHLSNEGLAEFLRAADLSTLELICLAHLSRTNNRPEVAMAVASLALSEREAVVEMFHALHDQPTAMMAAAGRREAVPGQAPVRLRVPLKQLPRQLAFGFE